jgi:hypothetical protein
VIAKLPKITVDVQGMPQNIYTQLLGFMALSENYRFFVRYDEIIIPIIDLNEVLGCTIVVEGGNIVIKGYRK